jgi:hypothetical protein
MSSVRDCVLVVFTEKGERESSQDAKRFYEHWGFVESPYNPMTLVARLKDLK